MIYIPSTVCFIAGALIAMSGKEGWGWFLFVGLLLIPGAFYAS